MATYQFNVISLQLKIPESQIISKIISILLVSLQFNFGTFLWMYFSFFVDIFWNPASQW